MKASIKKNGWVGGDIIVNENREIIDGQHRFQACKELKEPIRFTVKKDYGVREMQIMNETQRQWSAIDTVNSEAKLGNQSYAWLKELMDEYLEVTLMGIAKSMNFSSWGSVRAVRNRYFVTTYLGYLNGKEFCEAIRASGENAEVTRKQSFYEALIYCLQNKDIDNEKLNGRLKKYMRTDYRNLGKVVDSLMDIELMYNKYSRGEYMPI